MEQLLSKQEGWRENQKKQMGTWEIWPESLHGISTPLPNIWDTSELYILQIHSDGQERFCWNNPSSSPGSLKGHLSVEAYI